MGDFIQVQRRGRRKQHCKSVGDKEPALTPREKAKAYRQIVRTFKTEKCPEGWGGTYPFCSAGKKCMYAHTEAELRRDPLKEQGILRYARGLCAARSKTGDCPKGKNCPFSHNDCETMYHPRTFKTKGCKHGSKCERGIYCAFKHDDDILTPALRQQLFFKSDLNDESSSQQPSEPDNPENNPFAPFVHPIEGSIEDEVEHLTSQIDMMHKSLQEHNDEEKTNDSKVNPSKEKLIVHEEDDAQRSMESPSTPPLTPSLASAVSSPSRLTNGHPHTDVISPFSDSLPNAVVNRVIQESSAVDDERRTPSSPSYSEQYQLQYQRTGTDAISLLKSVPVVLQLLGRRSKLDGASSEALLELLVTARESQMCVDVEGNSALHHAAWHGVLKLVPILANSAQINRQNASGKTPVMLAVERENPAMLETLLQYGADLNVGEGALLAAIKANSLQCAFLLARSPAVDLSLFDENGNSALAVASERGFEDLVRELSRHTTMLHLRNKNGETPLAMAAKNGNVPVMIALLQARAKVDVFDNAGRSILMLAIANANPQCVLYILQYLNLDVHTRDQMGNTPLSLARSRGEAFRDIEKLLVEKGAVVDFSSTRGGPPLAAVGMPGFGQSTFNFVQGRNDQRNAQLPRADSSSSSGAGSAFGPWFG